jgi:hypothetical protein
VAEPDYSDPGDVPITTVLADSELEKQEGRSGYNVKFQGLATGRTSSYIKSMLTDSSGDIVGVELQGDVTKDGDSGGIYFHEENGEAYAVGVHHTPGVIGTTAETAEERLNGDWNATSI